MAGNTSTTKKTSLKPTGTPQTVQKPAPLKAKAAAPVTPNAAAAAVKPAAKAAAKQTPKAAVKAVAKPATATATAAAKPQAVKTRPAAASKSVTAIKPATAIKTVTATKPAEPAKAQVKPVAAVSAEKEKIKKIKLVRDSFTMPEAEYAVLGQVKKACLKAGVEVKKSELLRIGVALIRGMEVANLKAVLATLPQLKSGRPVKEK